MVEATSPSFCHGIGFLWSVMDYIHQKKEEKIDEEDYRMDEDDCTIEEEHHAINTIVDYTLQHRLLRAIGGESGANYIHRLLSGNHPNLYRKVLRIEKDVFTHLVSIFMERGLLKDGRFVTAAEIVAITLFILVRGASYRETENRFQRSPSMIGKYHKVLDGLMQLSADIVRLYQSQDELPAEILQKKDFYWSFFKAYKTEMKLLECQTIVNVRCKELEDVLF
ncbi:hypothetical protein Cgig2_025491 [Carnegiea gigantea]|uniref:DUF8040 domain-containing protein n=1 Tax=Carnegiea gigantea TaxID=171969 RepID=A0A9Q1K691_9CARY|nr:hypothetical protein Cgig2_025491 [Carnegiea gigantea]